MAKNVSMESNNLSDDNQKLIKVVSTKLSVESYTALRTIANAVYQSKGINKPTTSELL
jgi:hypothetical protein